MAARVIQVNINHTASAQDNLLQLMAERDCEIGILVDPYRIPADHPCWATDCLHSVAITWRFTATYAPIQISEKDDGFVAIKWGRVFLVAVYLPPSLTRLVYETRLDWLAGCIRRYSPRPVVIAGDFNAKSILWGSLQCDSRGLILEMWAAQLGLCLINTGNVNTCVRSQGESIVDLTWATTGAISLISNWRVAPEIETLSDHRCIEMCISALETTIYKRRQQRDKITKRWTLSKLNEDHFMAIIIAELWTLVLRTNRMFHYLLICVRIV